MAIGSDPQTLPHDYGKEHYGHHIHVLSFFQHVWEQKNYLFKNIYDL